MMERKIYLELIKKQLRVHSVCAILGARQVGKTTLARQYVIFPGNLEFPIDKNITACGLDALQKLKIV